MVCSSAKNWLLGSISIVRRDLVVVGVVMLDGRTEAHEMVDGQCKGRRKALVHTLGTMFNHDEPVSQSPLEMG